uniref:Uncharacterized protein n=1 Tax=Tanacetum cinerariifolium TaxID=118510 RepID=A0A6L2KQ17_TANCI|nr:hypothetical protein [Tanacetum cinerariifolium]
MCDTTDSSSRRRKRTTKHNRSSSQTHDQGSGRNVRRRVVIDRSESSASQAINPADEGSNSVRSEGVSLSYADLRDNNQHCQQHCVAAFCKSVLRDVIPKSSKFSPEHYATLVAYPAPFRKNGFDFLYPYFRSYEGEDCERQRDEDEPKLLDTTVGRVVPLLPVALGHSFGELEASVEKLFNEGGSGVQAEQGNFASGGHGVGIDVAAETSVKDVAPAQLKHQKKQKTKVADAGEPSHPAKKLRDDYGAPVDLLLVGRAIPTFPFVSSSVSTTPEREGGDHTEILARANLRAIGAPQRFVISSDSYDHSGVIIVKAKVDSVVRTSMPIITIATNTIPTADPAAIAKEKLVGSSVFGADSPSAGESHPIPGGFSEFSGSDFLIGEMVDEFAPPKFFAYVRGMDHDQLFTEFNVGAARQISLSAEVRMHADFVEMALYLEEKFYPDLLTTIFEHRCDDRLSEMFIELSKVLGLQCLLYTFE